MNVVIHTTRARADALIAIVEAEVQYARSQLQSRGVCALIDDALASLLADLKTNVPEPLVTEEDLAEYPEPGYKDGKPKLKQTKPLKKAMSLLDDGTWHSREDLIAAGIARGTVTGLTRSMLRHGLVEMRGGRFHRQWRLKVVA